MGLNPKEMGLALGALLGILLLWGGVSTLRTNSELKASLKEYQKQAEDAKKQAADVLVEMQKDRQQFQSQLDQERAATDQRIVALESQLSLTARQREASQAAYSRQSQTIQTQISALPSAQMGAVIGTVSRETKTSADTYNALGDRVQVGNDSFRAIASTLLQGEDIQAQNENLLAQNQSYQKDNATLVENVNALAKQVRDLIDSQKAHDQKMEEQIQSLTKAKDAEIAAKDAQVQNLTKQLKKEKSFFGNLKRGAQKIVIGIAGGLGLAAVLGI